MSPSRSEPRSRSGSLDEQLVADLVTEGVVHALEPVEVEEQHGHRLLAGPGPQQALLEPVLEQRPVGQPGERVVEGLVLKAFLRVTQLAHQMVVAQGDAGLAAEQVEALDLGTAQNPADGQPGPQYGGLAVLHHDRHEDQHGEVGARQRVCHLLVPVVRTDDHRRAIHRRHVQQGAEPGHSRQPRAAGALVELGRAP
ncbi:MAG: hypothetical protein NVSMB13_04760 [Mycobacteriales bacterium]